MADLHSNTKRLHEVMDGHQLKSPDVANLLNRSLKTVQCWRCQSPAPIPDSMLELLELKLATAKGRVDA